MSGKSYLLKRKNYSIKSLNLKIYSINLRPKIPIEVKAVIIIESFVHTSLTLYHMISVIYFIKI